MAEVVQELALCTKSLTRIDESGHRLLSSLMMLNHNSGHGVADLFLITQNHIGTGFEELLHVKLMA